MKNPLSFLAAIAMLSMLTACQPEPNPCSTYVTCMTVNNAKRACDIDGDGKALPGECQLVASDTTYMNLSVCDTAASLAAFRDDRAAWQSLIAGDSVALALEAFMPSHQVCFAYLVNE